MSSVTNSFSELPAVMDQERVADEIRNDRAIARPGLDRFAVRLACCFSTLASNLSIDVRAFFQRTSHATPQCRERNSMSLAASASVPSQLLYDNLRCHALFLRIVRARPTAANDRRFDGFRFLRVLPPLASTPVGLHGCRPPAVRPSPPPIGWLTGFIDVPRLCGLRAHPAFAARLAEADVHVVRIANHADRRPALRTDAAHFARRQRDLGPCAFTGRQRRAGPGAAAQSGRRGPAAFPDCARSCPAVSCRSGMQLPTRGSAFFAADDLDRRP